MEFQLFTFDQMSQFDRMSQLGQIPQFDQMSQFDIKHPKAFSADIFPRCGKPYHIDQKGFAFT